MILTGVFMLCYVIFGGMVATTWVQIVKAVLLMTGILVMSIFVLGKVGFNPIELFNRAEANTTAESTFSLGPGTYLPKPLDTVSLGLALVLGTAGLPHILMRFFTVPNAKAARSSVVWAMFIIGFFYLLTTFIGFGARAFLGEGGVEAAGTGGNLAAPNLAAFLGGGEGTFGGDLFLAAIAGVAFATILAVVAGLVLSASRRVLARHLVLDRPQAPGLRARRGARRADRRVRDRHHRDHHRRDRRLGPERLVHGRLGVRRGGERELPGAAAGADLAALQHDRRDHRRGRRRRQLDLPRHREPEGVARRRHRHRLADRLGALQPGHRLDPARLPRLLPGHDPQPREHGRAHVDELFVRSETGLGAERPLEAVTH